MNLKIKTFFLLYIALNRQPLGFIVSYISRRDVGSGGNPTFMTFMISLTSRVERSGTSDVKLIMSNFPRPVKFLV